MITFRFAATAMLVGLMAVSTAFAIADLDVSFHDASVTAIVAERPGYLIRAMPNKRIEIDLAARLQVQNLGELKFWRPWQRPSPVGDGSRFRTHAQIIGPDRLHVPERWPLPLPTDP